MIKFLTIVFLSLMLNVSGSMLRAESDAAPFQAGTAKVEITPSAESIVAAIGRDPYDLHNLRGENRFNIARQAGISLGKGALRVAKELKGSGQSLKLQVKESLLTIPNTFILGLAYHGKGTPFVVYIPAVQAVKEGGYGATECSFLAADAGEKMVAEAVLAIRQLTNSKRQVP